MSQAGDGGALMSANELGPRLEKITAQMAMPGDTCLTNSPEARLIAGARTASQGFAIGISYCASHPLSGMAKIKSLKNDFLASLQKKAITAKM